MRVFFLRVCKSNKNKQNIAHKWRELNSTCTKNIEKTKKICFLFCYNAEIA